MSVLDSMLTSIFYFELDGIPLFIEGKYQCSSYVFCRLDLPREGRRRLYQRLLNKSQFLIQGRPLAYVKTIPTSLPPFKRRISFYVETNDEAVKISIQGFTSVPTPISGFPTSLRQIKDYQRLESPFGTIQHEQPEKGLPIVPIKRPVAIEPPVSRVRVKR
jgi:hypothetical protein